MVEYRVPEFTLEQRVAVAAQMLVPLPERKWGLVSELAQRYAVSRTRLYEIRDQAGAARLETLLPRAVGRPVPAGTLTLDKAFIDRTIAILPLLKGSVRDIRLGLNLLLGTTRSVGYISGDTHGGWRARHRLQPGGHSAAADLGGGRRDLPGTETVPHAGRRAFVLGAEPHASRVP